MVLRQRVWIDGSVQGVLIGRIVIYWMFTILYLGLGSVCFQNYQHPDWSFQQHATALFSEYWPWLPSVILFLPLVIFDVVRLSNLFVGPIYRLRTHLMELNDDPTCQPLKFREDDYWRELAEPIHGLQAEILRLRALAPVIPRDASDDLPTTPVNELASLDLSLLDSALPTGHSAVQAP